MIGFLRGICHSIEDDHALVDVQGVGYRVFAGERDLAALRPGQGAELLIHTEVREDAFLLYGFTDRPGREMFRALLSVSGVGPKAAMALLSALTPQDIARAVHDDKVSVLTRAKGIGKRTAETIVVKLRDRLPPELLTGSAPTTSVTPLSAGDLPRDVLSALGNLGYKPAVAELAVAQAQKDMPDADFQQLMRAALAHLRRPG